MIHTWRGWHILWTIDHPHCHPQSLANRGHWRKKKICHKQITSTHALEHARTTARTHARTHTHTLKKESTKDKKSKVLFMNNFHVHSPFQYLLTEYLVAICWYTDQILGQVFAIFSCAATIFGATSHIVRNPNFYFLNKAVFTCIYIVMTFYDVPVRVFLLYDPIWVNYLAHPNAHLLPLTRKINSICDCFFLED